MSSTPGIAWIEQHSATCIVRHKPSGRLGVLRAVGWQSSVSPGDMSVLQVLANVRWLGSLETEYVRPHLLDVASAVDLLASLEEGSPEHGEG